MSDLRIVIVDDEKDILEIHSEFIQQMGFEPVAFEEVESAIEYISKNIKSIALVLSDYKMGEYDGFQFATEIKKKYFDLPIVIVTGYWSKEMAAKGMSIGVSALLEKPTSLKSIQTCLKPFIEERSSILDDEKMMIEGFVEESAPILEEIESLILELEEKPDSEYTLSTYFRLLHTIKGTAACVGLNKIGEYTHNYEDFISKMRTSEIPLNTDSINTLLQGYDYLKNYLGTTKELLDDSSLDISHSVGIFNKSVTKNVNDVSKNESGVKNSEAAEVKSKAEEEKMTVSMKLLNQFMEESGELTVIRNSIVKTVRQIEAKYRGDVEVEQLNELVEGMYSVTSQIQSKITEMRKVPLKQTFRPFKRLIRDLSKQLDKDVNLEVIGEDLSVDNTIAKLFSNTLIHLLRNSMDHGIEDKDTRIKSNKSPQGSIVVEIVESGEDILLKITDDGRGIDPEKIKSLAVTKNLISIEEAQSISDLEVINYIFESGFSTAKEVSDLSGRGVGMDMVRSSFKELGGDVVVTSQVGKGSTFHLTVPVPKSVLIIGALQFCFNGKTYLFPMDEVAEVIQYQNQTSSTRLLKLNNQLMMEHNDEIIEVVSMADLFEVEPTRKNEGASINLIVLRYGDRKFAIIVDEISDFEEVVSKAVHPSADTYGIYEGAALLGTGDVAMILKPAGIAMKFGIQEKINNKSRFDSFKEQISSDEVFEYMIYKYNDYDFLGIDLERVFRLETLDASRVEYVGDKEVYHYLGKTMPLVDCAFLLGLKEDKFTTDMQSELKVIVVEYKNRKFGLVVHEMDEIKSTTEKMSDDTIDVPGLLGSTYIQGKTFNIIDLDYIFESFVKVKNDIENSVWNEAA